MKLPLLSRLLLIRPERVVENLARVERAQVVPRVPNPWQLTLGVLRMWHRVIFRSDTIGTSSDESRRPGWRARAMHIRPLRFPFLLAERAVAPWDFSGLLSSPERITAHLLGAFHDREQFVYDLEILRCHPGALERVRDLARDVVERDNGRSRWLKDLVVYEGYHERLLEAVERALEGGVLDDLDAATAADPDVTFAGYIAWCARQPETPEATWQAWRDGRFSLSSHAVVS
jgi:hypothetical protein